MDVDAPFAPNMKKIASVLTALGLDECNFEQTPRRPDPTFRTSPARIAPSLPPPFFRSRHPHPTSNHVRDDQVLQSVTGSL